MTSMQQHVQVWIPHIARKLRHKTLRRAATLDRSPNNANDTSNGLVAEVAAERPWVHFVDAWQLVQLMVCDLWRGDQAPFILAARGEGHDVGVHPVLNGQHGGRLGVFGVQTLKEGL